MVIGIPGFVVHQFLYKDFLVHEIIDADGNIDITTDAESIQDVLRSIRKNEFFDYRK